MLKDFLVCIIMYRVDTVWLLQYHGGTNFGRTSSGLFIATSYDYDAPIDEYGTKKLLISTYRVTQNGNCSCLS